MVQIVVAIIAFAIIIAIGYFSYIDPRRKKLKENQRKYLPYVKEMGDQNVKFKLSSDEKSRIKDYVTSDSFSYEIDSFEENFEISSAAIARPETVEKSYGSKSLVAQCDYVLAKKSGQKYDVRFDDGYIVISDNIALNSFVNKVKNNKY